MTRHKHGKQNSGGEPKKGHETRGKDAGEIADGQDGKRGNLGPSGQGTHRGRERHNVQTGNSGRPDVSSQGKKATGNGNK